MYVSFYIFIFILPKLTHMPKALDHYRELIFVETKIIKWPPLWFFCFVYKCNSFGIASQQETMPMWYLPYCAQCANQVLWFRLVSVIIDGSILEAIKGNYFFIRILEMCIEGLPTLLISRIELLPAVILTKILTHCPLI